MRFANWQKPLPELDPLIEDLALRCCSLGGEQGAELSTLIKSKDYASIVAYTVNYKNGATVMQQLYLRQALALFSKRPDLPLDLDREAIARDKFIASEEACKSTNSLFRSFARGHVSFTPSVVRKLFCAQRKIRSILGPVPALTSLRLAFGPGATTRTKKSESNPSNKMGGGLTCSFDLHASGILPGLLRELPHWTAALDPKYWIDEDGWLVEECTVSLDEGYLQFVPKDAKTDRSIVVEPVLNTVLQGGIGSYLKNRLRRAGIDISDQSLNKRLAREGSLPGAEGIATLDLSSASDTISYELVKFLLPESWFNLLAAARSGTIVDGSVVYQLEKFSSMGNGYTFPLETLIFWALAKACEPSVLSVYGDDIVVSSDAAGEVIDLLNHCGFAINDSKSFVDGPFRESCGGDYFFGIDIRPFYLKKELSVQQLFLLHNFFVRNYEEEFAQLVLSYIPPDWRLYGPDGYGDGHLVALTWRREDGRSVRCGGLNRQTTFKTLTLKPRSIRTRFPGDWVSPLYSIYVRGPLESPLGAGREMPAVEVDYHGFPIWPVPGGDCVAVVSISI